METNILLAVSNLRVGAAAGQEVPAIIDDISFDIKAGETFALVGESGSGKSMTAVALMGLLPDGLTLQSGQILFDGKPVHQDGPRTFGSLRGREIAMIFQEPAAALNPVFRIGTQILDVVQRHHDMNRKAATQGILELFRRVELSDPDRVFRSYPHQLSGGMAQRCMIAMALACRPGLIIADEPTTALDVITQRQILSLLANLQQQEGFSILLISHDLQAVSTVARRVAIMKSGKIVEQNTVDALFHNPQTTYARQLLASAGHQFADPAGIEPQTSGYWQ